METDLKTFLVTVVGEYIAYDNGDVKRKTKKKYKIQVRVAKPEGALSVIKNKLLDRVLRKKYPDYCKFYTHEIVNITDSSGAPLSGYSDINLMNFNELAEYVKLKKLPLKLSIYMDIDTLRSMIYLAETNPKLFQIRQNTLAKDVQEERLLAKLNPNVFDYTNEEEERTADDEVVKQKKQSIYIPNKGFVPVEEYEKEFKEDFDREDEKPFEVYRGKEDSVEDLVEDL